jgi:hypothetical protein
VPWVRARYSSTRARALVPVAVALDKGGAVSPVVIVWPDGRETDG